MRSRFVIPAALLVTVAYVKGRLDANLLHEEEAEHVVPVATPPVDPILRAQAEAEDAIVIAEAQAAASAVALESPAPRDLSYLSEWLTTPTWGSPPRRTRDAFDPARLAEWATNPAWGPQRTRAREVLDAAALAEWASDPAGGEVRRARTRDAFEAAALAEWVATVAWTGLPAQDDAPPPEPGAESAPARPVPAPAEPGPAIDVRIDETGRFSLGGWAAQPGHMVLCGVTFRDRRDAPVDPAAIRLTADAASNVGDGGLVVLSDAGFAPDREGFTILLAAEGPGSFAAAGRYEVVAG